MLKKICLQLVMQRYESQMPEIEVFYGLHIFKLQFENLEYL